MIARPDALPQSPVSQGSAHTHRWQSGQEQGWLRCEICSLHAVCKACEARKGTPPAMLVRFPDVFCLQHQCESAFYVRLPVTLRDLAARLIYLAGTIPHIAWRVNGEQPAQTVEAAHVQVPGFRLLIAHRATCNGWRVFVYVPGVESAPMYAADGPSHSMQVRFTQPGSWVTAVRCTISLRDAEVLPVPDSIFV